MPDKPHISPSQMESLTRCGEAHRRRYIEKERVAPGIAAFIGTGVHLGAEHNFRQKVTSGVDLPKSEIIEVAAAGFEDRTNNEDPTLTEEERSAGRNLTLGKAKDEVRRLADFHARVVAPVYQPVAVEQKIRLELPNATHDLLGVIDVMTLDGGVADIKTVGTRKPANDAHVSVQLSVYAALYRKHMGKLPTSLRLDYTIRSAGEPKREVVVTQRGPEAMKSLAARISAHLKMLKAGVYQPADPRSWFCSEKWCPYHSTCPFVQGLGKSQGD